MNIQEERKYITDLVNETLKDPKFIRLEDVKKENLSALLVKVEPRYCELYLPVNIPCVPCEFISEFDNENRQVSGAIVALVYMHEQPDIKFSDSISTSAMSNDYPKDTKVIPLYKVNKMDDITIPKQRLEHLSDLVIDAFNNGVGVDIDQIKDDPAALIGLPAANYPGISKFGFVILKTGYMLPCNEELFDEPAKAGFGFGTITGLHIGTIKRYTDGSLENQLFKEIRPAELHLSTYRELDMPTEKRYKFIPVYDTV